MTGFVPDLMTIPHPPPSLPSHSEEDLHGLDYSLTNSYPMKNQMIMMLPHLQLCCYKYHIDLPFCDHVEPAANISFHGY